MKFKDILEAKPSWRTTINLRPKAPKIFERTNSSGKMIQEYFYEMCPIIGHKGIKELIMQKDIPKEAYSLKVGEEISIGKDKLKRVK